MGLDAFVRCRCFEEGKLKDPPVPYDDLYVDEDGYIWSKAFDDARKQLECEAFHAQYGELMDALFNWTRHACEHERMRYCSERVANVSGWGTLQWMFDEIGPDKVPILCDMLPDGNGGCFPVEKAEQALEELQIFRAYAHETGKEYYDLIRDDYGIVVHRVQKELSVNPPQSFEVFQLENGFVTVTKDGKVVFRSKRFEKRRHKPESPNESTCELADIESGSLHVLSKQTIFVGMEGFFDDRNGIYAIGEFSDADWADWKADILERLLRASLETGNPIQWS